MLPRKKTPFEKTLGHRFRDPALAERAVTHRSFANEQNLPHHNERLEFLGDAVLGMLAAELLFREHPDQPEGELSRLKARLVSTRALARYAERLGIGEHLRLGVGEERSGGRSKRSLLADATEAVFGAVYLDGGLPAAQRVLGPLLEEALGSGPARGTVDAKTALQEEVQGRGWELPAYELVDESGPDHQKRFTVECRVDRGGASGDGSGPVEPVEPVVGRGEGRSKKQAEQEAAAAVRRQLAAGARRDGGADDAADDPSGDAPPGSAVR